MQFLQINRVVKTLSEVQVYIKRYHNHSTTPTSGNYFRMSCQLITTHNNNS